MMDQTRPSRSAIGAQARWALAIIVIVAAIIRLQSLAFGLPAVNDQDELIFQLGAVRMLQEPTLNPHWFGHPATTTMYALAISDVTVFLFGIAAGWWHSVQDFVQAVYRDPTLFMLPGRAVMAAFGLLSIGLTARLGEKVADWKVGLVAAALLMISPLHIELSQIIRSDMMATCFILLSMLAAVSAAREPGPMSAFAQAGAWAGIAIATKWPSALVLVCIAGVAILRWCDGERDFGLLLRRLAIGGGATVFSLLLVSPFLLLDWRTVVINLAGEARPFHLGATGGSFLYNLGWYGQGPILRSLGPIGSVLALAGTVLLAARPIGRFLLLPFLVVQVLVLASQNLVWERWFLPLLPVLAISVAYSGTMLWTWLEKGLSAKWALLCCGIIGLATAIPMAIRSSGEAAERMHDTRQHATRFVMQEANAGSSVLVEHFGFDLLKSDLQIFFPVPSGCLDARATLSGKISLQDVEGLRGGKSNVDIGAVPEHKAGPCRADFVILSHYDRYKAEKERFPQQYGRYRALVRDYETLAVFRPVTTGQNTRTVRVLKRKSQFAAAPAAGP